MSYMEPTGQSLRDLGNQMATVSRYIDDAPANVARDPEAQTWGRVAKVANEAGEVLEAWIGVTGQNPRKGIYGTREHVQDELLDVVVTALAAWEHMTGNKGESIHALSDHVTKILKRAGLR